MNVTSRPSLRLGFWVVLLLGAFAWAPATYPGYWEGLEGFVPILNATQVTPLAQIATTPDLWRGSGADTYLLVRPLLLIGFSPTTAVRVTFIFALLLGGFGIYVWLRARLGDRAAGLAGLLYTLLPPFLATVYIRGSLSDALIMGLLPMSLAGVAIFASTQSRSAAVVVVISLIWMWRTQAGLALLATLLLLVYTLYVERYWLAGLVVGLSGAAGLTSLIPLWATQAEPSVPFDQHFVALFQLFGNQWQVAPSLPGWEDQYPFQLGYAVLVFSLLAFWYWQLNGQGNLLVNRLLRFGFIGALLLLVLTLGISAPLWQWSGASRLLTYPWQIMVVAGPLLALTAGSLPAVYSNFNHLPNWAVLVALTVLSSYGYLTTDFTQVTSPREPAAVFGAQPDLVILAAKLNESEQPPKAEVQIIWQVLQPLPFDDNIFLQAQSGDLANPKVEAQLDTQPLGGQHPATQWRPGEILTDTYQLDLSGATVQRGLRYVFGYYNWQTGQRLPREGGVDDKLILYGK